MILLIDQKIAIASNINGIVSCSFWDNLTLIKICSSPQPSMDADWHVFDEILEIWKILQKIWFLKLFNRKGAGNLKGCWFGWLFWPYIPLFDDIPKKLFSVWDVSVTDLRIILQQQKKKLTNSYHLS